MVFSLSLNWLPHRLFTHRGSKSPHRPGAKLGDQPWQKTHGFYPHPIFSALRPLETLSALRKAPLSLLRGLWTLRYAHGPLRTTLPPLAANSPLAGGDDVLFSLTLHSVYVIRIDSEARVCYSID